MRALARRPAVVHEGPLGGVELTLVGRRPVERGGEPRAAVQLARIAAARVPFARGHDQVVVEPAAVRVLLEPAAQPRPLAQQRLVGDLGLALADRHEPVVGEHVQDVGGVRELGERDAPPHRGVALADAGHPQQDRLATGRCSGARRS